MTGWFIDNAGVYSADFNGSGSWISPTINLENFDSVVSGKIGIRGELPPQQLLNGSIIDYTTNQTIVNLSNVDFPISVDGLQVLGFQN